MVPLAFGRQVTDKAVVVSHGLGTVADEIGRFLGIAHRFHPVFAHFQAEGSSEVKNTLADQISCFVEQCHSFLPGRVAPGWESGFGGDNSLSHILSIPLLEMTDDHAGVNGACFGKSAFALTPGAVDIHGVVFAQLGFNRRHIFFIILMQQRVGAAHV